MAVNMQLVLLEAEYQVLRQVAARANEAPANYLEKLVRRHLREAIKPVEVDATDKARQLAEIHGLDLTTIEGSGAGGRILVSDVVARVEEDDA